MTPEQEGIQILFDRMTAEQLRLDLQEAQETIKDKDCELEVRALYTRNTNAERDAARLALQESQQETEAIKQELRLTRGLEERLEQSQQRVKELEHSENLLAQTCQNNLTHMREQGEKRRAQQAVIQELAEALKEAKATIRVYHGEPAWEIYERCSPEIKKLNAALASAAPWLK